MVYAVASDQHLAQQPVADIHGRYGQPRIQCCRELPKRHHEYGARSGRHHRGTISFRRSQRQPADYDEIWLFGDEGYDGGPVGPGAGEPGGLTDSELTALTKFMRQRRRPVRHRRS